MLNISPIPSIFKASPEDNQVFKSQGYKGIPGDLYNAVEVVVDASGQGDYLTIAEAFTFLGTSPGVVYIKAGSYTITATITLQNNQELRGSGYGTLITTTMDAALVTASGDNTGVYDLRLDGNVTGTGQSGISGGGNNITVRNVWIQDMGGNGIVASGSTGFIVDGCRISNCNINGIYFAPVTLGAITNNDITTCDDNGIKFNPAYYNTVVGNNIHNCGSASVREGGILIVGISFQNIISSNSVRDNAGANETGIYIYNDGNAPLENIITNNLLKNNTTDLINQGTNTQIGHNIAS